MTRIIVITDAAKAAEAFEYADRDLALRFAQECAAERWLVLVQENDGVPMTHRTQSMLREFEALTHEDMSRAKLQQMARIVDPKVKIEPHWLSFSDGSGTAY